MINLENRLLELFYKELYRQATFSIYAYEEFTKCLKEYIDEIRSGEIILYGDLIYRDTTHVDRFWYHVQSFFFSLGMVWDILFISKANTNADKRLRCSTLRANLEVQTSSPLNDKRFRNWLTHFDEKIQENFHKYGTRLVIDNDFAVYSEEDKRNCIFVRNYNSDERSFTFFDYLDKKPYKIEPIVEELERVRIKCYSEIIVLDNIK